MADESRHQSSLHARGHASSSGSRRHDISLLINDNNELEGNSAWARNLGRGESNNNVNRTTTSLPRLIVPSFDSHRSHEGLLPAWQFDDHRRFDPGPAGTSTDPYTPSRTGDQTVAPAAASATMPVTPAAQSRKRPHATSSHDDDPTSSTKRSRISNDIEEIDLATEGSDQAILEKERAELVQTQRGDDEDQPKSFGQITCMICLDNFTNLTTTACGHIFCHECLTRALIAGEKSRDSSTANCPACRKSLKRKTKGHVIPLKLMTRAKFQADRMANER